MNKADYLSIKQQLNFDKPLHMVAFIVLFDLLLVWCAFRLIAMESLWSYIASQLLLALFFFHNFALMHEAGHVNVHKNKWVNYIVGHYSSVFCFMPFFGWKYVHHEHHVWNGNLDKDWTLRRFRLMRESGHIPKSVSVAWHSWFPMFAIMQHVFMWAFPFVMKNFGRVDRRMFWNGIISDVWLIFAYSALIYSFPEYINLHNLGLAFAFYLFGQELVNLPHHAGVPIYHTSKKRSMLHAWEQHYSTRSCYMPRALAELLVLNFNLHIEHHMMPTLPWFQLHKAKAIVKGVLGDAYTEVADISWCIDSRLKDPARIILDAPELAPEKN